MCWFQRGYGESDGIPSEEGLELDAIACLDYLKSRSDINTKSIFPIIKRDNCVWKVTRRCCSNISFYSHASKKRITS